VPAEIQRGDSARVLHEADNREFSSLTAFNFQPAFVATGAIRRLGVLRDDPLPIQLAGVRIHVSFWVVAYVVLVDVASIGINRMTAIVSAYQPPD
jgi:hypothetical protein